MKRIFWGLIILALVPWGLEAQLGLGPRAEAEIELFIEEGQARPGDTVHAGVLMTLPFGRHTYWRNPGDVAADTVISWTLPKGCTVGEISWPIPQKYFSRISYSYVYEGQVLLMIPLHLDKDLAMGPHKIRATVEWVECDKGCYNGKASVSANVVVGEEKTPGKEAKLFDKWRKLTPEHNKPLELPAWWVWVKGKRSVRFRVPIAKKKTEVYFFPLKPARANYAVEPATVRENGEAHATLTKKVLWVRKGKEPTKITGVLVRDGQGWNTTLKLGKAQR